MVKEALSADFADQVTFAINNFNPTCKRMLYFIAQAMKSMCFSRHGRGCVPAL
jgi:hypothetical protein